MDSNSQYFIGIHALNLAFFKELPQYKHAVMLLKRLACLFPRGQTFDPHSVVVRINGRLERHWLAAGFPMKELRNADNYLIVGGPWWEIVHNGYVAEAPPGSGRYEITNEGWDAVKSNTVEVDNDYISTILP